MTTVADALNGVFYNKVFPSAVELDNGLHQLAGHLVAVNKQLFSVFESNVVAQLVNFGLDNSHRDDFVVLCQQHRLREPHVVRAGYGNVEL